MNSSIMNWKQQDKWTWKELTALLLLEFGVVIGCIKFVIAPMYTAWFSNELYSGTLMGLTIAIVLLLGVYFIALRPQRLSWSEVGLRSFPAKDWWRIVGWTLLYLVGSIVVMELTVLLVGNSYDNSKTEAMQQNVTVFAVSISFISAAIISPIYEEIFYRGFLYRWLRTRLGVGGGIFLSSSIFTIIHIPTYNAMPVNFLCGIVTAWAYERTNSIWPAMIIHGAINAIAVLLTSLG
ncbi:CPBP family intramembrane metalloprotease [Paenibacillus sp. SC116]|uniref:CPBP family intramembrane glutamic endopeptidase n=1 Tax=Paenibacillus sp. SC116 TaxID=2968986 RepID=UPI00215A12BC|nr:type II CAAX endopeptidase family protein [Paenibacillus sp. SC116]MCR8844236.1 CPBP family intramembrane metalloprotease [Paenibacillus sp. SC116]